MSIWANIILLEITGVILAVDFDRFKTAVQYLIRNLIRRGDHEG